MTSCDVLVVGGGSAGLAAAVSAGRTPTSRAGSGTSANTSRRAWCA